MPHVAALPDDPTALHGPVLAWFDTHARELPWRGEHASAWSVMVSEFMLQQTPVARVLPMHEEWLRRWPTPADLALAPSGEAVRSWGRLGYPRRALRLHAAAVAITEQHDGVVPADYDDLIALPGVGDYTASAIASFAYGRRHVVLDTNVRRVLARAVSATEFPPGAVTRPERDVATALLPDDAPTAATWAVAVMELGALVCTASSPRCADCPLVSQCAWVEAGKPPYDGPPRRGQTWAGTDRQCRGRLLAVLRDSDIAVAKARLDAVWSDVEQRERCLASLLTDRLAVRVGESDTYALP
ncbi:A/G-specific adenine glycosylase [Nocardioides sp.]|uniref:A/G-specific adenine glycosylase n=1 Tax=Nocardioides sp. TaxID=35761 RepID=UPI002B27BE72|nr:A/G-specific adenine glycosylase [Nocardioides sp.]